MSFSIWSSVGKHPGRNTEANRVVCEAQSRAKYPACIEPGEGHRQSLDIHRIIDGGRPFRSGSGTCRQRILKRLNVLVDRPTDISARRWQPVRDCGYDRRLFRRRVSIIYVVVELVDIVLDGGRWRR